MVMTSSGLLIVGNGDSVHVGSHLRYGAHQLGLVPQFLDLREAYAGHWLNRKLNWHLGGHQPNRLEEFSKSVLAHCKVKKPAWLVATGLAPINDKALKAIAALGTRSVNFLTDDPWNRAHLAPWFLKALPSYSHVFTPRAANISDLEKLTGKSVSYLPFAYSPDIHYRRLDDGSGNGADQDIDVCFVGGADSDRIPYIGKLIQQGFRVALYGGYWQKSRVTRRHARGFASPEQMRRLAAIARVNLCLVRRANRDGHCMRTFELAAMGACILAEDTPEHRNLFGEDGFAVRYFSSIDDMVDRVEWLLSDDEERARMGRRCHELIVGGQHRYSDRLRSMIAVDGLEDLWLRT